MVLYLSDSCNLRGFKSLAAVAIIAEVFSIARALTLAETLPAAVSITCRSVLFHIGCYWGSFILFNAITITNDQLDAYLMRTVPLNLLFHFISSFFSSSSYIGFSNHLISL